MNCGNFFAHGKHSTYVTTIKDKGYEFDREQGNSWEGFQGGKGEMM